MDAKIVLEHLTDFLRDEVACDMTLIWPVHPRTKKQLIKFDLYDSVSSYPGIILFFMGIIGQISADFENYHFSKVSQDEESETG